MRMKRIYIQKDKIIVGRDVSCELYIDKSNTYVSRMHAVFFYEDEQWYIMDNYSCNGTWVNGNFKLTPGEKYRLEIDDEIDFAHTKRYRFFGYAKLINRSIR